MNHFSYDVMRKEKIRGLQKEGMISQAVHRSCGRKAAVRHGIPGLLLWLLGALGLFGLLIR